MGMTSVLGLAATVRNTQERNLNEDVKMRMGAPDPSRRPKMVKWKNSNIGRSCGRSRTESPSRYVVVIWNELVAGAISNHIEKRC